MTFKISLTWLSQKLRNLVISPGRFVRIENFRESVKDTRGLSQKK